MLLHLASAMSPALPERAAGQARLARLLRGCASQACVTFVQTMPTVGHHGVPNSQAGAPRSLGARAEAADEVQLWEGLFLLFNLSLTLYLLPRWNWDE